MTLEIGLNVTCQILIQLLLNQDIATAGIHTNKSFSNTASDEHILQLNTCLPKLTCFQATDNKISPEYELNPHKDLCCISIHQAGNHTCAALFKRVNRQTTCNLNTIE